MQSQYIPQYTITITSKELKLISLALTGRLKDKDDLATAVRLNLSLMATAHKGTNEQNVSIGNALQYARDAVQKLNEEQGLSKRGEDVREGRGTEVPPSAADEGP